MPYQHQIKPQKQKFKYRNRKIKKLKIYIRATFEKKTGQKIWFKKFESILILIQLESNEDATKTCFRCARVKKKRDKKKALELFSVGKM